jgi:dipeptidyl aminopeptidase/acylaminoacyl peptidase
VAVAGVRLGQVEVDGESVLWIEGRPAEGGRNVVVRREPDGRRADASPPGFNVRTRVHEYGGGGYLAHGGVLVLSSWEDQRLYRRDPGEEARPITPEPPSPAALRYADGRMTPDGRWVVCVRESHGEGEPTNEVVAVPASGDGDPAVLAGGRDFCSFPRPSPNGRRLAWTCWDHPNMPWDGTELWTGELRLDGALGEAVRVAGGSAESVFAPEWSPEGRLHWVSDPTGWWNLYREGEDEPEALAPLEAEFGAPQWVFGLSSYAFLPDGRIACAYGVGADRRLGLLEPGSGRVEDLDLPWVPGPLPHLRSAGGRLAFVGVAADRPEAVVLADPGTGECEVLARAADDPEPAWVSVPRTVSFSTEGGAEAHAVLFEPANPEWTAPEGERPPLLVLSHGGPTGPADAHLDPEILFFTSRGFAVAAVDYGGSTGYGRAYRERLRGQWGIVDVDDCVHAARHLAEEGAADPERLVIRGGSAGGWTTLCALAFRSSFAAGSSHYGVADAERLATDTHKFESRYLDGLIGPYPERADLYRERSPLTGVSGLDRPLIIFQGLEDEVVPPSQAEVMVEALRRNGVPHAYLAFEGEQHGFRRGETIRRVLEAELSFLGQVLGFEPADALDPVRVEGLARS